MSRPDALVIGAPDAGTDLVNATLASHARVRLEGPVRAEAVLEDHWKANPLLGPGDSRRRFRPAYWSTTVASSVIVPSAIARVGCSPFALWDRDGHGRLASVAPRARLVVVVRDPVERAFASWARLRSEGLETESDFLTATALEDHRAASRWAPWWRYVAIGRYGEQLEHLYDSFPAEQVLVVRYRDLVEQPDATVESIGVFLDLDPAGFAPVPAPDALRGVGDRALDRTLAVAARTGERVGRFVPPAWEVARRGLHRAIQREARPAPSLSDEQRAALTGHFRADVERLSRLTGRDFTDWLDPTARRTSGPRVGADAAVAVSSPAPDAPFAVPGHDGGRDRPRPAAVRR